MSENEQSEDAVIEAVAAFGGIGSLSVAAVQAREGFSAQHLWAALHFARLCEEREDDITSSGLDRVDHPHRSYAMAAVKFAVSFLESLVNDLLSDAADPYMSVNGRMTVFAPVVIAELATVWNESEVRKTKRIQLLDKYQRSLRIAGAAQFVKADRIYSEVGDVIYLRNELVHFKVGWQQVGAKQNQAGDIERRLTPRFPHNRQKIGMPWFPNKCLASGCARWACDSATAFADEWLDRMSLPHDYKQVVRDLGTP